MKSAPSHHSATTLLEDLREMRIYASNLKKSIEHKLDSLAYKAEQLKELNALKRQVG